MTIHWFKFLQHIFCLSNIEVFLYQHCWKERICDFFFFFFWLLTARGITAQLFVVCLSLVWGRRIIWKRKQNFYPRSKKIPPRTSLKVFYLNQVIRFWNVSNELLLNNLTLETQWHFQKEYVKVIKMEQKIFKEFSYDICALGQKNRVHEFFTA